jgi:D-alanyl-D-alanine dipeptidase
VNKKILLLCLINSCCFAATTPQTLVAQSQQLIIVSTPNWNSVAGEMQRFSRDSTKHAWHAVGKSVPVVIGKNGMGWDMHLKNNNDQSPIKHEGDGLTPAGVYAIGPAFGFDEKNNNKLAYFPLTDASVCVDDVKSTYYNQLIEGSNVSKKDWNSGEQMRQVPNYKLGAVVQYNTKPITAGAGSCIFMHIWKSPTSGTAGCIAMEEPNLLSTLNWLDAKKNPVIAIFPQQIYNNVKSKWKLPA